GVDFAGQIAGAVALAARLAAGEDRNQHLETALDSRSTIDRAIGVIMVRARIDAADAFDVLRRRSQHTNTKLREVAVQVLDEALHAR
ncbi:ANTAR domain-containing protein, partial [Pseudonocardia sp. KRD291]|uniref:ANTAR domain-containing protein n=1 Tax=Pseudonocardia sp. KRD291 TaxID=2792007 RepID=UPI001C4A3A81